VRKRTIWASKAQQDPLFGALPVSTQWAYWLLQCFADDDGRLLWAPMYIGTCLSFPAVSVRGIEGMMTNLVAAGQVKTYEQDGQTYAVFMQWYIEQSIDRPGLSKNPDPPAEIQDARPRRRSRAPKAVAAVPAPETQGEGKDLLGESKALPKKGAATKARAKAVEDAALQDVFDFYCQVFDRPKTYVFSAGRRKAIRKQLRDGYSVVQIKQAIVGNLHSAWHQGRNDRDKKYNDLVFIFHDASRVDSFIERFHQAKKEKDRGTLADVSDGPEEQTHQDGDTMLADIFRDTE